ncbi:lysozyme family protein [Lysinibacillus fusiformis]|uniref:lysozyme family protein n=1 Tax=Lysinibacillus fusiformis TaxID=28031 RepID=UPI000D38B8D2|nr:lysozyme family protein [Lysinibacillus fusiformis]MED4672325.1 lysozyme family protein [Lysinibacillus fusiformis]RDV25306.1 peptidase M23 [Lysinibacillus fusiformis]GED65636.1 hypothetical protein LFU01_40880 [Lysinibacillus fusiformis]
MKGGVQKAANAAFNLAKWVSKFKFNIATFKIKLIVLSIVLFIGIVVILVLGSISIISNIAINGTESNKQGAILESGYAELAPEVLQYRDALLKELKKENKAEYIDILLALMMQESGGKGNDPMQASESKCGRIGCITNPQESIRYGVIHFLRVLEMAKGDIELTLQSYNFGSGFINYTLNNGGKYTYELAVSFSQMMYEKLQHTGDYKCHRPEAIALNACYGDILYVQAVMRYVGGGSVGTADGYYSPLDWTTLRVTSPYGYRNIGAGLEFHYGVDYACTNKVDPVYAVQPGEIMIAGTHSGGVSYGNFVTIKHSSTFYTTYAHLSSVSVKAGDQITGGTKIGVCGATGRVSGPHLHFETKSQLWRGYYDPQPFVNKIVEKYKTE